MTHGFDLTSEVEKLGRALLRDFRDTWQWPNYDMTNVMDKEDSYVLDLMVPGYGAENIKVTADDGILQITGKKEGEEKLSLSATYKIPDNIAIDAISAKCLNGVLTVILPKLVKSKKKVEIEIETK